MFVGESDLLANPDDAAWIRGQIGDAVVHYEQMPGGHLSFLVGKDMDYFRVRVVDLLSQYHPVDDSNPEPSEIFALV